jgi:hypothetical protein
MSIINEPFCSAYTPSTYERFRDERMDGRSETEYKEACRLVVTLAEAIAGGELADAEAVEHFLHLILEPGSKALLDNELVTKMSEVSL